MRARRVRLPCIRPWRPSTVFVELGARLAKRGGACEDVTAYDLYRLLAEIGRGRANRRAVRGLALRLAAEVVLNTLQLVREKRFARWRERLFRVVHRALSLTPWLAPLPDAAPDGDERRAPPEPAAARRLSVR